MKKICVLGLGYIGLPTAAMFATHGYKVLGVDTSDRVLSTIQQGEIHIQEPGLKTLVSAAVNSGNLTISSVPENADIFIIAVPTPITEDKKADLSYVVQATESISPYLAVGNLVILEATSPPRTTIELVLPILEQSGLCGGEEFYLAYSPERVLPGKILHELVHNSRVIGGINQESARAGKNLYEAFVEGEIILTDTATAEMVKLMENTYRDINIAIANEFSRLAVDYQVDIWEAISIANRHPRVNILQPGPGVGGHCISVDPWFFIEKSPEKSRLIRQARLVNDQQPDFVVDMLADHFGSLDGKRFAVLGLTYKANIDDLRESPILDVVGKIINRGGIVSAYDPNLDPEAFSFDFLTSDQDQVFRKADGILLMVNHRQFENLNPERACELVQERYLLDTRKFVDVQQWENAGFVVHTLGDGRK